MFEFDSDFVLRISNFPGVGDEGSTMKRYIVKIVFILLLGLICPWSASAAVEWQLEQIINLDKKPIDMVMSARGTYLFVLTDDGIVHVFDSDGSIKGEIDVEKHVDRIASGPDENILILKSKKNKEIRKISIDFLENINVKGLPYKGNADAPVVIAVYTDYQ